MPENLDDSPLAGDSSSPKSINESLAFADWPDMWIES